MLSYRPEEVNLNQEQYQIVLGTMLGDGNLHIPSKNARFITSCREIDKGIR